MKIPRELVHTFPLFIPRSYKTSEGNKTGSWRFLRPGYLEKTAPCSSACPLGQDVPTIQMLTVQGAFKEAWEVILRENPFPGICGRVCFHPCETACNRGEFDEPVAIHMIERFLADTARRYGLTPHLDKDPSREERIAIIGSGPGGLAASYFLTLLGYSCDVFESQEKPGGMLRWAIPFYRLPLDVLEEEISRVESIGIKIYCDKNITEKDFQSLKTRYNAVFVACGHQKGRNLGIVGENLPGVVDGLDFLIGLKRSEREPRIKGNVAVIGGGNTAIDVARSLIRCGAEPVIVYRRRKEDMRAFQSEVEMAEEEGVKIWELKSPVKVEKKNGKLMVTLQKMEVSELDSDGKAIVVPDPSEKEEVLFEMVFKAIGTEPSEAWYATAPPARDVHDLFSSRIVFEDDYPVLYGGDLFSSAKTVTNAIASGKEVAIALDAYFKDGKAAIMPEIERCRVGGSSALSMEIYINGERSKRSPHVVSFREINSDYFTLVPRIPQPRLLKEERVLTFAEIDLKISASMAMKEAGRCFNCGICNQCDNCYLFCPEIAVVRRTVEDGVFRQINYDYCKGCGLCVVECPRNAMVLEEESA